MSQEQKKHDPYDLRAVLEAIELDLIQNLRRNLKRHGNEEEKEGFRWEMWQKAKLRNIWKYRKENRKIVGDHSKEIEEIINKTLQESFDTAESVLTKVINKVRSFFSRRGVSFPKGTKVKNLDKPARPEEDFFGVNEKKIDALQEAAMATDQGRQEEVKQEEQLPEAMESPKEPERKSEPEKPKQEPGAKDAYVPEGKEKNLTGKDNDQKLDDLKKQVNKDMQEAQRAIWRRMDDIYRQTIYKAEMFMAAGAKTLDQAIDMATKEFLDKGIDCIEYRNGCRVNIASYAEMALRTASQRATFLAEGKKRDEWGIHTVFVSAHANTCPLCAPWQGKVLVDDVFSSGTSAEAVESGYPLLSAAMKAGLLHPNCRHTLATYFPGITILPAIPDSKKAIEVYEAEQKQRELERKIRKAKRKVAGACDNDNIRKAQAELRDLQRQIREHLDQHPELRRDYNREKTRGTLLAKRSSNKYGYENFDKAHLAHDDSELLPNCEKANIPDGKLTGYALNKEHPKGKDKAIAFEKYLGYNISNKDELLWEVEEGLKKYKCSKRAETQYGQPYEVAMVIKGANGKYAKVKTGWIINNNTNIPRLTTIYVDEG